MTDRLNAYTVILARDTRADDAEAIEKAIRMIKGVADVVPNVSDIGQEVAEVRARLDIEQRIWKALREKP